MPPIGRSCAGAAVARRLLRAYRAAFSTALQTLGYRETMAGGLTNFEPDRIESVVFTLTGAFDQTPGRAPIVRISTH